MDFVSALVLVLVAMLATSYGWGMRGAVIGGEKGALLPGAFIGMTLALFSGIDVIRENWQLFTAVGCLAMGFGGFEPYAETMGFVLHHDRPAYKPSKGYLGLSLKGSLWFGICGAFLGISLSAFTGKMYQWYDFVVFAVLMQPIQMLGMRIFNKPYDREKSVVSKKIYFSIESREEWGGNLLMLICLIVWMALRGDLYSILFSVFGMVFGALGWCLAIWLYDVIIHPLKNGKRIMDTLQKHRLIDSWKIMEFTLGACGGLGLSLYFVLSRGVLINRLSNATNIWNPLGDITIGNIPLNDFIAWILFALALICILLYVFVPALEKKFKNIERSFELLERTVLFGAILATVLLGNMKMARIVVFCLLLWVVTEKNVFERLNEKHLYFPKLFPAVSLLIFALSIVGEILLPNGYTPLMCVLMYTIYYILSDMMYYYNPKALKAKIAGSNNLKEFVISLGGAFTVHLFFIVQAIVLIIAFKNF